MDENTVSKCILKSLKNNVGDLALSISLESEEPLAEEVKCYLKLKERRSGAEDVVILEKESPAQYSASINIHSFPEPLEMGQTYDFYVVLGEPAAEEEQPKQVRLTVEAEAIERAYHLDHTTELLILPYTTDKGNFSLKVKREAKIVKFDEIQLKAEEIMISGYAGYLSSENQLSVKNLQFVIKKGEKIP
ncbi:hypothetical protein ACTWKC_07320 [Bacillus sp. 4A_MP3]